MKISSLEKTEAGKHPGYSFKLAVHELLVLVIGLEAISKDWAALAGQLLDDVADVEMFLCGESQTDGVDLDTVSMSVGDLDELIGRAGRCLLARCNITDCCEGENNDHELHPDFVGGEYFLMM